MQSEQEDIIQSTLWTQDISILFKKDLLMNILPTTNMTFEEKLNSMTRLLLYFSILLYLIKQKARVFLIPMVFMFATYLLYNEQIRSDFENESIHYSKIPISKRPKPTEDNPFMNSLLTDYGKFKKAAPKSYNKPKLQQKIERKFESRIFQDVNDVFNRNNSQREFYTTPSTTIPNEQKNFAKWLYNNPTSQYK